MLPRHDETPARCRTSPRHLLHRSDHKLTHTTRPTHRIGFTEIAEPMPGGGRLTVLG